MSILDIKDLKKNYRTPEGENHLVVDIPSFQLASGEQVALRGGSGTGKTTFLNLIAGILQADSGSIILDGTEITGLPEIQRDYIRGGKIGYIFQTFNLLQGLNALENVMMGMAFVKGVDLDWINTLLEKVGLENRKNYLPRQMSVGQQQRVAVARALSNRPKLVLADEPTGNLDFRSAKEAIKLIRSVCSETGASLLLVSHDQDVLDQFDQVHDFIEINKTAVTLPTTSLPPTFLIEKKEVAK